MTSVMQSGYDAVMRYAKRQGHVKFGISKRHICLGECR